MPAGTHSRSSTGALAGLLLLADARAPSGAHVHSGGLEAAVTAGLVHDLDTLRSFLAGRLATAGLAAAAFAAAACDGAPRHRPPARADPGGGRGDSHPQARWWRRLDRELDARTPSPAHRGASRSQGRGLLRAARRAWPGAAARQLLDAAAAGAPDGAAHHPVVLGVCVCLAGSGPREAATLAAYAAVAGPASAAVRLAGFDPLAVQACLTALADDIDALAAAATAEAAAAGDDPGLLPGPSAPGLDLLAGLHLQTEVRLFDHDHGHGPDRHAAPAAGAHRALRLGIGGPVGSGKTALVAGLCRALRAELALAVVTNDIYTEEDADFLRRAGVLDDSRISAVRTGCCPHTAIRDDIVANLDAVEALEQRHAPLDLVIVESGGDNLTATFSRGLVDRQIFVLDTSGGDKVPRKGGPGVATSDLLVVNKTDLAPLVGADLGVMARDAAAVRGERPVAFTSLREQPDAPDVAAWVREQIRERQHG